jgi:hypothetical protein
MTDFSALDLYGGRDAVSTRLNDMVRESVMERSLYEGSIFESIHQLPGGSIAGFVSSEKDLSHKTLFSLANMCGISLFDVLGEREYKDKETQEYWENEGFDQGPVTHTFARAISELRKVA